MPATVEPPAASTAASTFKSFADLTPTDNSPEPEPAPEPSLDAGKAAAEAAAAATKAAETKAAETKVADPGANPHLEREPAATKVEKKDPPADDEIPKGMTKKAEETWKSLKQSEKVAVAERDATKAELAALKKQLDEAGKTGPEVERLKKEREELAAKLAENENEIALTRVEATSQFKAQVSGPIKASEETTKALAAKYEVAAAALLDAIREPDAEKRADMLSELSADFKGYDAKRLFDAADAHATAAKAGEEMRTNASTKLTELTKQAEAEAERVATANLSDFRKAADSHWKALQELHPILRPVEGNAKWNAYLDSIKQEIESTNVNDIPVADVARMRAESMALPEIVKAKDFFQKGYKERGDKIAELEKRLKDLRATEPGAGAGGAASQESGGISKFADLPI